MSKSRPAAWRLDTAQDSADGNKGRGLAYQMQDVEEEVSDLQSSCPGRCATLVPLVMHGCERPLEWMSTAP